MSSNLQEPKQQQPPRPQKPIINVLALDGGGIRGLIPLRFLQALEESTGQNVHDIFHTIVGTSTGGFITALLSLPSLVKKDASGKDIPVSAGEALKIYRDLGPSIFPPVLFGFKHYAFFLALTLFAAGYIWVSVRLLRLGLPAGEQTHSKMLEMYPWTWILAIVFLLCLQLAVYFSTKVYKCWTKAKYSGGSVVRFCRGHFGEHIKLKDAKTNVGICATDIQKHRSFIFNSMRSKIHENCPLHSAEIAKIARATSAAPTYFSPEGFNIVPKEERKEVTEKQKATNEEREMTPWDSRDVVTSYDRVYIPFEDGGTKMNNPSKAAIKLAQMQLKQDDKNPDDYEIRLLSVGTGTVTGKQDDPTKTYHGGILHWLAKKGFFESLDRWFHKRWTGGLWGVIERRLLGDVFEVLINAYNDHLEVRQHYRENGMEESYRRQQFKITEEQLDGMDDCSEINMETLVQSAENMVFKVENEGVEWSDEFRECVGFLKLKIVNKAVLVAKETGRKETQNEKKNK